MPETANNYMVDEVIDFMSLLAILPIPELPDDAVVEAPPQTSA